MRWGRGLLSGFSYGRQVRVRDARVIMMQATQHRGGAIGRSQCSATSEQAGSEILVLRQHHKIANGDVRRPREHENHGLRYVL